MTDNTVDTGLYLTRVAAQRNAALDEAAKAMAKVDELLAENQQLKAEVARLMRGPADATVNVVPGTVEG